MSHKWSHQFAHFAITGVVLAALGGCSSDGDGESVPRLHVVLDYSPTLSDADALLYLASNPAIDLLAVTLPGTGEADCDPGTRITRALLTIAGSESVPIGCGRNAPLIGDRDWPDEWRVASNSLGDGLLPEVATEPVVDAEQLLVDTFRAASTRVTLVAVGPLTNLGAVLGDHPELAANIERIVIMGGALALPGNVEESPAAEWNIYIDPEAARRVIASGIAVTIVPLDATNYLPWTDRLLSRLGALGSDAAATVRALANQQASLDGLYLWDELAAMVAAEPTLVTTESMTISIHDDGALVRDPEGHAVQVAVSAATSSAVDEFVNGLNGGTRSENAPLTAIELEYFVTMGGADSDAALSIGRGFEDSSEADLDPHGQAAKFINAFVDAIDGLAANLALVSPPRALAPAHTDYVASLTQFVAIRDDVLALVAASDGTTVDEIMAGLQTSLVADALNRVADACQVLVDYSFIHDGPRPCSFRG